MYVCMDACVDELVCNTICGVEGGGRGERGIDTMAKKRLNQLRNTDAYAHTHTVPLRINHF